MTNSLSKRLNLYYLGVVLSVMITSVFFVSVLSFRVVLQERKQYITSFSNSLAQLIARPVSLGHYALVEDYIQGQNFAPFLRKVSVFNDSGILVAKFENTNISRNLLANTDTKLSLKPFHSNNNEQEELEIASLSIEYNNSDLVWRSAKLLLIILIFGVLLFFFLVLIGKLAVQRALFPLLKAVDLQNDTRNPDLKILNEAPLEIQPLIRKLQDVYSEMASFKTDLALGKMAQQAAHDIRSPLSSVQAAAQYLGQMRIEDPKAAEVLNLLELSAKRLTGIADDLLKKHKGGVEEKSDFSIHQVLDELVGEFHGQEKYQSIQFVKQYSSKAIHIQGNAGKLQRAFGNIIKNGAEAMEFNGTVTLGTREDDVKVIVSLSDTGPGMPSDKLERVLGGGFTEGKADGHGIGMKVVKETAEEHGGRIWGESVLGKGTSFFIELPVTTHKSNSETFTLTLASKGPVLVVDDDPGLREQWRLTLRDQGIRTLFCDSMEDLLRQKISSHLTKTAVIDYHYDNSEKTGAEIIQHLKEKGFTNVYLCTAEYWKPSIQKLAKDLGVDICPKPLPKIVIVSEAKQANGVNGIASVSKLPRNDNGGYIVLVIDDDLGIRMSWEMMQKKLGISKLHAFPNLEALQKENCPLDGIDIAFVDKNIEGSQFSGAQVVQHLKANGVTRIALASGESEETLRRDPQFSNVDFIIGKNIPTDFKAFFL